MYIMWHDKSCIAAGMPEETASKSEQIASFNATRPAGPTLKYSDPKLPHLDNAPLPPAVIANVAS